MGSDELDKILDRALASYSQEEPRPGLSGRVSNRIGSAEARRFVWLRWVMAIPAIASFLLLVFWIFDSSKPSRSTFRASTEIRGHAAAFPSRDREGAVNIPQKHHARVSGSRPSVKPKRLGLPKPEQFPTPTPLTAEERVLLAFVSRSPKQAQKVLGDAKSRSAEPIQIQAIQIEPLQNSGE
jgi:hypothetical protein